VAGRTLRQEDGAQDGQGALADEQTRMDLDPIEIRELNIKMNVGKSQQQHADLDPIEIKELHIKTNVGKSQQQHADLDPIEIKELHIKIKVGKSQQQHVDLTSSPHVTSKGRLCMSPPEVVFTCHLQRSSPHVTSRGRLCMSPLCHLSAKAHMSERRISRGMTDGG
jgi:hypothetical protein